MDYSMRTLEANNDGLTIEAIEWFPPSTAGQGLPLVFIPGGTASARTHPVHGHAGAMGKIGSRARRVLAVSRRGTGLSDAPPSQFTPADFARDVRAAIDVAGYKQFVLFCHSMGVPIGLEFALGQGRGLVGLVLGDAPPQYIDFKAAATFDRVLAERFTFASWDEAFEAMTYRTNDRVADRLRFDALRDRMFVEDANGTIRYLLDRGALQRTVDESVSAKTDYAPLLDRINVPVLLVLSSSGWSPMSTDGLDAYQRSVGDLTIERLQTDHDLGQRTNPEPLHSAIGALLDRLDAANSAS